MTETQMIKPAPIVKELRVRASAERAFAVFAKMGGWWLEGHSVLKQLHGTEQADLVIEPRTGGRWYELGENGKEYDWGRVLAWEPPARLLLCWQLNGEFTYDPALETTIEVTFTEDGDHTLVRFEHRDLERFGAAAAPVRDGMDSGWGRLLEAYRGFARLELRNQLRHDQHVLSCSTAIRHCNY